MNLLWISAPIICRGSIIRFIGRLFSEASPERVEAKGCPDKMPEIRRVVVPLFPTSSILDGAESP